MRPSPIVSIVRVRKGSRPTMPEHGLFDGKRVVQYIKVHENPLPGRNPTKVRKHRAPNVQIKNIFSPTLGGNVRTHITTSLLKKIDKVGGLDNYVMQATPEQLGVFGLNVKYEILKAALRRQEEAKLMSEASLAMEQSSLDPLPANDIAAASITEPREPNRERPIAL